MVVPCHIAFAMPYRWRQARHRFCLSGLISGASLWRYLAVRLHRLFRLPDREPRLTVRSMFTDRRKPEPTPLQLPIELVEH
jgi:hypothetical protein